MFSRICLLAALAGAAPLAAAADVVTKPEAEAMVKKALAYLKANGREKTFAEIDKKDGQFVDRDLYLTV
jgi:cytochrome c